MPRMCGGGERVSVIDILLYIGVGGCAGAMAGLLGIGGGLVVVPALVLIFSHMDTVPSDAIMHMAAGTSLAVMVLTSQASVRAHIHFGRILWNVFRKLLPGVVVGTICGAIFADLLNNAVLKFLFGLFLLTIGVRMLLVLKPKRRPGFPPQAIVHLISFFIGMKSGLFGVGGGALTVPFLTRSRIPMRNTAGISSLVSFTVALMGTVSFIATGYNQPGLPQWATGYVYWPAVVFIAIPSMLLAPMGAKYTYRLSIKLLKRLFAVFLVLTGINMLW